MTPQADSPTELVEILLRSHESKDFDYKASAAWDEGDKKTCYALVKDILAMANTMGGYIVIGVSETPAGYSFEGLSDEHANRFDTSRLNRFLQVYADPPINALLKKIVHRGKTFVVIEVPPFTDTPHLCQKDYRGVLAAPLLYVRTDNNESAQVKSPADFKSVIERSIRNRSDALLASFRAILTAGPSAPSPSTLERFNAQRDAAEAHFPSDQPTQAGRATSLVTWSLPLCPNSLARRGLILTHSAQPPSGHTSATLGGRFCILILILGNTVM